MTWDVFYTEQAERDLEGIYEYIAHTLLEPMAAARQSNLIMNAVDSLDSMPLRHRRHEKEPWHSRGLRIMPVGKYLKYYQPIESQKAVAIMRVMHSGRDADAQL